MADYNIKAEITADASGFESGVKKAEKASKNLSTSVSGVIQGLGKSGLVGALGAVGLATGGVTAVLGVAKKAFQAVSKTVKECSDAYRTQYKAEIALDTAISNNPYIDGTATRRLKEYAGEIQSISEIGDEQLLPMMADLIAKGRTEAETMDLVRVATDMSATGTISFENALTQLNATLNGNLGRLGQQNAELKNLTEEELKNGKAVEILGNKYKGLAQATADSSKQLKNALGDLKENLGKVFENALAPMRKFFTEVITNLNNSISKSRELKDAMKDAFNGDDINIDATTDSLSIAFNEVLKKQQEVTRNYSQYIQLYGKYIDETTDETVQSYKAQIADLNKQIKTIAEELNKRRKESEKEKKARAEAEAQAEQEKTINDLKEKYLKLISEQETKWKNIKKVTGEAVKDEEKLKFYQDQLVSIMSESNGLITENNQYYKDQMSIIDEIVKRLNNIPDVTEEQTDQLEELDSEFSRFVDSLTNTANDWTSTINGVFNTVSNTFADVFTQMGKDLVEGGASWEEYSKMAIRAIADVLAQLGKQLLIMAVAKAVTYEYASASLALVGATIALGTSGILTAVSNKIGQVSERVGEMTDKLKQAKVSLEDLKKEFESISQGFTQTTSTYMSTFTNLSNSIAAAQHNFAEAMVSMVETNSQLQEVMGELNYYQQMALNISPGSMLGSYGPYTYDQVLYMQELSNEVENLQNELSGWQEVMQGNMQTMIEEMAKLNSLLDEIVDNYKAQIATIDDLVQSYNYFYNLIASGNASIKEYNVIFYEQLLNVKKLISSVYTTLTQAGQDIGSTLISSIIDGASKEDFLRQMKNYIRQNLLKLAVYTESFQNRLAEVGTKIATALTTGGSIADLRTELETLWNEASTQAQAVEQVISSVFGDLEEIVEETVEEIDEGIEEVEEKISTFEQAMLGFQETISDLGGEIANSLVEGLSEGLSQSDFLDDMKKWIRKMLVESLVYTKTMKSEIEAIGQAITKGLSEGFTETTFHEIRRDLSWVFEQANQTINGIDNILNSVFGSGYATGTNSATSGLHLVGEAGPELVRFSGGEKVYNANETRNVLSSGNAGNTFNVTFQNTKDTTAFAMIQQLKQYNRQMAINGVM